MRNSYVMAQRWITSSPRGSAKDRKFDGQYTDTDVDPNRPHWTGPYSVELHWESACLLLPARVSLICLRTVNIKNWHVAEVHIPDSRAES